MPLSEKTSTGTPSFTTPAKPVTFIVFVVSSTDSTSPEARSGMIA